MVGPVYGPSSTVVSRDLERRTARNSTTVGCRKTSTLFRRWACMHVLANGLRDVFDWHYLTALRTVHLAATNRTKFPRCAPIRSLSLLLLSWSTARTKISRRNPTLADPRYSRRDGWTTIRTSTTETTEQENARTYVRTMNFRYYYTSRHAYYRGLTPKPEHDCADLYANERQRSSARVNNYVTYHVGRRVVVFWDPACFWTSRHSSEVLRHVRRVHACFRSLELRGCRATVAAAEAEVGLRIPRVARAAMPYVFWQ